MSNALTTGAQSAIEDYLSGQATALDQQLANEQADSDFAVGFLSFSGNTGEFTVKDDLIARPSLWAFNVAEAYAEWLGWSNNKVHDRMRERLLDGGFDIMPQKHELPEIPIVLKQMDGWQKKLVFPVRDLEGEYDQLEFTIHADNGRRPAWGLVREWNAYMKMNYKAGDPLPVPIVEITSRSFPSQGGTKYAPVFKIEDWSDANTLAEQFGTDADVDDGGDQEEASPKTPPTNSGQKFGQRRGGRTA